MSLSHKPPHSTRGADWPLVPLGMDAPWSSPLCSAIVRLQEAALQPPHQPGLTFLHLSCPQLSWRWPFDGTGSRALRLGGIPGAHSLHQLPCSCHRNNCLSNWGQASPWYPRHLPVLDSRTNKSTGQTETHLDGTTPLGGRRKHRKEETNLSRCTRPMLLCSHCMPWVKQAGRGSHPE